KACLDFHALHWQGDHVWVVGQPGSVMLHSANNGASWNLVRTRQPLPLHGVYFADEQCGWAVGDLGSILATSDGGKTWTVQHRGGHRVAVLFVHADAAGLPLDTAAVLGQEEGYLSAALRVAGPDPSGRDFRHGADGQRFAAAFRRAGGTASEMLWQFPLPTHS